MASPFLGSALPLDSAGLESAISPLGVRATEFWAVLSVETSGCGFLPDRRPKILFERHVFHGLTQGRFDGDPSGISNATPGGYGPGGAAQYDRLALAMQRDRSAALQSASWGLGQVMGYHATKLGYASVEAMVDKMVSSEAEQLRAMASFVNVNGLAGALRLHDWPSFAQSYNGANYRINNYDTRLSSAYAAIERGGPPDLTVRAGQMILSYLGHDPNGVDGVMGRMTRSAMNDFQRQSGLPITDFFDDATMQALRTALAKLPIN